MLQEAAYHDDQKEHYEQSQITVQESQFGSSPVWRRKQQYCRAVQKLDGISIHGEQHYTDGQLKI